MVSDEVNKALCDERFNAVGTNKRNLSLDAYERNEFGKEVLISGLPQWLKNPIEIANVVCSAGEILDIKLSISDIHQCYWLKDGRNLIVKFTSFLIKDLFMKKYLAKKNLVLSQIRPGSNISSRIYFNNNLPPETRRLLLYSRKLKKINTILNFKMNFKQSSVVITSHDNSTRTFKEFKELRALFPIHGADNSDSWDVWWCWYIHIFPKFVFFPIHSIFFPEFNLS